MIRRRSGRARPRKRTVPRVSVVIPCYNAAGTLGETLDSILSQSFDDFEVIVVDDGSDDDPRAVVDARPDPRLRYRRIARSGAPSRPRNVGVADSHGEIVFFCDADDVMLPGKIEHQLRVFDERPHVGMVFTDFQVIDECGQVVVPSFLARFETLRWVTLDGAREGGGYDRRHMLRGLHRANFVGMSSVAIRRSVLHDTGGFDESLESSEDFDLWLRVATATDCMHLDEVFHQYRYHVNGLSQERSPHHPLARIRVLERERRRVEDPGSRRDLDRRIGSNHFAAAWAFSRDHRYSDARAHYRRALRYKRNWSALKAILTSMPLVDRLVVRLRKRRRA